MRALLPVFLANLFLSAAFAVTLALLDAPDWANVGLTLVFYFQLRTLDEVA